MKKIIQKNIWLLSAVAYPLSWVGYGGLNLSFLAWIAFVPLFEYLSRNRENFKSFYGISYIVILSWSVISAGWLVNFPTAKWLSIFTIVSETFHISIPFLLLYFLQKKIAFERSLILLPFFWTLWERIFIIVPHAMATHLLPYGQGNNLWLIQMADLGGMGLISFWVVMFNVVIYLTAKSAGYKMLKLSFLKSLTRNLLILILPVLLYGLWSINKWNKPSNSNILIAIIPTNFSPQILMDPEADEFVIEHTLHRTDSLAFDLMDDEIYTDLVVWPETGSQNWMNLANIAEILTEACGDWGASLITGCKGIQDSINLYDKYVTGIMISPPSEYQLAQAQWHHKTKLVPGTEIIPYQKQFSTFFNTAPILRYAQGTAYDPLILHTQSGAQHKLGVSICYEQWFPSAWYKQVRLGAQFMVHMAAEGWYGHSGYQQYMANVSKIRAVENRKSVARCTNGGLSTFINPSGKFYNTTTLHSNDMSVAEVGINDDITIFTKYPEAFHYLCLIIIILGLAKQKYWSAATYF